MQFLAVLGYVLLAVLGILLVLLLVAVLNAVRIKDKSEQVSVPEIDMDKALVYGEKLSKLIQVETINERDMTWEEVQPKFDAFHALLGELYPNIQSKLENIPVDEAVLYRWKGKDSTKPVIVLIAHSDVVPAQGEWKYPPFSGTVADGAVWGRGAMDNKGSLCCAYEAVDQLVAEGFVPERDIFIGGSTNEETMGKGALYIANYLEDNDIKIDLVLDEGGAVAEEPIAGLKGKYAMVGIVEKGYADIKFTARSAGGHSSGPGPNTPIARLSEFVCEVEKKSPFNVKLTAPVKDMFKRLAPTSPFPLRLVFGNLWLFGPIVKKVMPKLGGMPAAMLRTTCVFTMSGGSDAPNVIPNNAYVVGNLRFMTHQPQEESVAVLKKIADKYDLEMEILRSFDVLPMVDTSTKAFAYVYETVETQFPDASVATYVIVGGTDAKYFADICPTAIRFAPLILTPQQLSSMHADDENIDITALARGVGFYKTMLENYPS